MAVTMAVAKALALTLVCILLLISDTYARTDFLISLREIGISISSRDTEKGAYSEQRLRLSLDARTQRLKMVIFRVFDCG